MKNQLERAVQHDYACFQIPFAVLGFLARKPKVLHKVQLSTRSTITCFRAWKENLFTLPLQVTDSVSGMIASTRRNRTDSQEQNPCAGTRKIHVLLITHCT